MVDERTVLVTLGVTLALGVLAIAYLREPLRRVLFDICRKRDHARFWAASADVLLLAVPLAFELLLIDLGSAGDSPLMWTLPRAGFSTTAASATTSSTPPGTAPSLPPSTIMPCRDCIRLRRIPSIGSSASGRGTTGSVSPTPR
jgi:hypothetical protein